MGDGEINREVTVPPGQLGSHLRARSEGTQAGERAAGGRVSLAADGLAVSGVRAPGGVPVRNA